MAMEESKRDKVFQKTDWQCFYCQNDATTIDHMIPRSRGGTDAFENLVGACETCNQNKADMTIDEFIRWKIDESRHIRRIERRKVIREKSGSGLL